MPKQRDPSPPSGDKPPAMDGADAAALGLTPTAGLDPPRAEVDATDNPPPAAFDQLEATRQAQPWATSLVYQSPQAGVDASDEGDEEGHIGRAANEGLPPDQL